MTAPLLPREAEKIRHGPSDPQKVLQLHLVWLHHHAATARHMTPQSVVRTAEYITGAELPAIQDLYTGRCQRKAQRIVKDSNHPGHRLFTLLPHGKSGTTRTMNSFYPQAC